MSHVPGKKYDSRNTSEKTDRASAPQGGRERGQFNVGDLVKPIDIYRERGKDTGTVESIAVTDGKPFEGEQYVVQWQRDRNVRHYTHDELTVAI
jgi:hypothetical protein